MVGREEINSPLAEISEDGEGLRSELFVVQVPLDRA